jgi:hypothetical protein
MWRTGTRFRRGSERVLGEWVAEEELTTRSKTPVSRHANGDNVAFLPAGFSPTKTFNPFSPMVAAYCGHSFNTTDRPCMAYDGCSVLYDWVSTTASGDYYGANAYSMCKSGGNSCGFYQSVVVANNCSSTAGGGGGGGHWGGLCDTSWDCGAGETCSGGSCG